MAERSHHWQRLATESPVEEKQSEKRTTSMTGSPRPRISMSAFGIRRQLSVSSVDELTTYEEPSSPLASLSRQFSRLKLSQRILLVALLVPLCFFSATSGGREMVGTIWRFSKNSANFPDFKGKGYSTMTKDWQRSLVDFGPWAPAAEYKQPPRGCEIDQISILGRPTSQYPEEQLYDTIHSLAQRIRTEFKVMGDLQGFNITESDFGSLTDFGRDEAFAKGARTFRRYRKLFERMPPYIRTPGNMANLQTVEEWARGINEASELDTVIEAPLVLDQEFSSIADNNCPWQDYERVQDYIDIWASSFTPGIVARLNAITNLAKSLDGQDVLNIFMLCAHDSARTGSQSPVCSLFTKEEAENFAYWRNLEKHYLTGAGNFRYGRPQGIGWSIELLARLENKPRQFVVDPGISIASLSQIDLTAALPLDRSVYLDSTSDSQMIAVLSALGFRNNRNLDPRERNNAESHSEIVLFGGEVVVERMLCKGWTGAAQPFVRVLANDKILRFNKEQCPNHSNKDGLCPLKNFIQGQKYARGAGFDDFQRCGG